MLRFFGSVVMLAALLGAIVVFQGAILRGADTGAGPKAPTVVVPTRAPSATAPAAGQKESAQSFDQKATAVAAAEAKGSGQSVHLVLSEQEVSAKIQQSLTARGVQNLRNVTVKLGDGQTTLSGTANVGGMDVPVDAILQLGASQGFLTVNVTSLKAAGMGLPDALQKQLMEQVQQATGLSDLQKIDLGIDVQRVQVAAGQLQIDGQTR